MDRVFSVEDISDPFWGPSPATSAVAAGGGGGERRMMSRSSSEWMFEKFLEQEAAVPKSPNLNPNPSPNLNPNNNPCASSAGSSNFSSSQREGRVGGDDEVVEIKKPQIPAAAAGSLPSSSDPTVDVDPREYAAMLKQKLDMYCHAVAIARVICFLFEFETPSSGD